MRLLNECRPTDYGLWLNVAVRRSWSYTTAMPVLPPFGTGLAPLMQWLIVPRLAWQLAQRPLFVRRS